MDKKDMITNLSGQLVETTKLITNIQNGYNSIVRESKEMNQLVKNNENFYKENQIKLEQMRLKRV